ncbi:MAG: c-type cytochrome [Nitrosospira sp.]|nr:c-type cytochrome [Nitrosospira sp.]
MSDTEGHDSAIKTPKQLITVLLLAIVFPIAIVVLLAQYATGGISVNKDDPALTDESVAKRLKPVGELVLASDLPPDDANSGTGIDQSASAAPVAADSGADKIATIYTASCAACHISGAAGAPKQGDKAAWAPRIKNGNAALYASAIKGKGAMPAKGGNVSLSDDDVKAVVDYMVSQAK